MELYEHIKEKSETFKFNNYSLRIALEEWCDNEDHALKKYGHISHWDTSEVTNMARLFSNPYEFNSPIGNWDVSNVTTMNSMFSYAYEFNQEISKWDVSKVTNMSGMFYSAESFNQPIGDWDVSNVINMKGLFRQAKSFNQPIGKWNVSKVEKMNHMFEDAISFNQDISKWDVSNVTDMSNMFADATSFNQPIGDWDVSNVKSMDDMLDGTISFEKEINWKNEQIYLNVNSIDSIPDHNTNKVVIEKSYYDTGELLNEFESLNGKRHGYSKVYHKNGQLRVIIRNEHGIQVDEILDSYDDYGNLIRTVEVRNGNLNGPFKEYYPSGLLKREGEYKDDEILGIPVEYLEDGEIRKSLKNFENTITPDNISQIKFENKFGIRRIVDQLVDLDKKYYQQVTYGLILLWVMDNDDDQIEGDLVCDLFSFLFSDEKKSFVNMDNIEIDDIEPRDDENFPLDELESIYKRDIENYGIELKRIVDIEKIKLFAINFIENYEV
jgi:surface protein